MFKIQEIGYDSYNAILNNNFDEFGKLLDDHYMLKEKHQNLCQVIHWTKFISIKKMVHLEEK